MHVTQSDHQQQRVPVYLYIQTHPAIAQSVGTPPSSQPCLTPLINYQDSTGEFCYLLYDAKSID